MKLSTVGLIGAILGLVGATSAIAAHDKKFTIANSVVGLINYGWYRLHLRRENNDSNAS